MDVNKKVVQCRKYPITYTLVIKRVKNINMRISPKEEVVASANPFVFMDKIGDFVSNKVSWTVKHQKSMQERGQESMIDDKHIILFGNSLKIRKTTGKYNHISYDKGTLYVQCREQADPEKVIRQFPDKLCRDTFLDIATLTFHSLSDHHPEFSGVKIRNMKSRWGSCTPAKDSITLNRKLIHYPFEFIRYVVLHESVHFIQPNHSKAFYNIIENYTSDYRTRMEIVNQEKEKNTMVHIITDTSALFTVAEGNDMGVHMTPLCVGIQDEHYRDLCFDMSPFLEKVCSGGIPTTLQLPIGDVLAAYGEYGDEEILNICMADGLSGTYQTVLMAKEQAPNADSITVLNLQAPRGPHCYLVEKVVKLHDEGKKVADIVVALKESTVYEHSFLTPQGYSFLKRGECLKLAAAGIGGLLKPKPVIHVVEGGSRLDKLTIIRILSKAIDSIINYFREHGVDAVYRISVPHADALADAHFSTDWLKNAFPDTELELLKLSPAFITQGGPQCIVVQCIRKQSGNTLSLYRRLYIGRQNRRNRCPLVGYVVLVIMAGLLSGSTLPLPDWFREYGGDTLWSTMMHGIFVLLFPKARVKSLLIATLLFLYLIECLQLLDYDWFNTLRATPLRYLLGQGFVWSGLLCYNTGCILACLLDVMMLGRGYGIHG